MGAPFACMVGARRDCRMPLCVLLDLVAPCGTRETVRTWRVFNQRDQRIAISDNCAHEPDNN
jgi:hypothetical protein